MRRNFSLKKKIDFVELWGVCMGERKAETDCREQGRGGDRGREPARFGAPVERGTHECTALVMLSL